MSVKLSMYWKIEMKLKDMKVIVIIYLNKMVNVLGLLVTLNHNYILQFFFANGFENKFLIVINFLKQAVLPSSQLTFKQQFC